MGKRGGKKESLGREKVGKYENLHLPISIAQSFFRCNPIMQTIVTRYTLNIF